jgi:hypothetical protein
MNGVELLAARDANRMFKITIDLEQTNTEEEPGLIRLRNENLYKKLCNLPSKS